MGNPSCPFCNRMLESGIKQSYRADGALFMVGSAKTWECSWCGKFWWKGNSTIMRQTANTMDRRGVIAQVKMQIARYLANFKMGGP